MKLKNLSSNIVTILNEIMTNQQICKYLFYNQSNPLSQPDIADTKTLMLKQLFPYPFNPNINEIDTSQLRVYYGRSKFGAHEAITDTVLIMDIIIPNAIFLVDDTVEAIRPYEILNLLVDHFSDQVISQLGTVFFKEFVPLAVNDKYDGIRIYADVKIIG